MNPTEMEKRLGPVLGPEIAKALADVARFHKTGASTSVSVPTWVMVVLGEKLAELARGK